MLELHLYIDGQWLEAQSRKTEAVLDPATGAEIGRLPHASTQDLDQALAAAQRAFPAWRDTPPQARSQVLRKGADLLRQRSESLAAIMSAEQGKTVREAAIEIGAAADILDWAAEEGKRTYGRVIPPREPGWRQTVLKEPMGVVAAFTPWNFPTMIPARKIAGALAAGCTCIIKPSEEVPASALALARALHDAGLPPGVLNVVFGVPSEVSEYLIRSPIVRKVSFTGSTSVGRVIGALTAAAVKPVTLELGGHAPVLVFDDVDVDRVVAQCVASKFRNAGQVCISPTRFIVQRGVYDAFVDRMAAAAKGMKIGRGSDPASHMGPLANERRVRAMGAIVDDATTAGARVAAGGKAAQGPGFFFEPTVLADLSTECRAMNEEPFGPIALVVPFDTEEQAIAEANRLNVGLASYAFTNNADRITRLGARVEAGMLGINTFFIAGAESPFGGVKDSGHGLEGGIEGVDAYLTTKYVAQAPSA